jgi:predicted SAM-dependent methyltransferase
MFQIAKVEAPNLINLGCGDRIHSAWINYDLHARVPGVIECDFLSGIPLEDGSASVVYSAAVLEHVPRSAVPQFLEECRRILRPNGLLRFAVPDFERQARLYLDLVAKAAEGDPDAAECLEWMVLEMIDQVGRDKKGGAMAEFLAGRGQVHRQFLIDRIGKEGGHLLDKLKGRNIKAEIDFKSYRSWMVRGSFLGVWLLKFLLKSKDIRKDLAALEVGRFRLFQGEVHQWVYDRASLIRLMEAHGFGDLRIMAHGESRIPDWKSYQLEIDENGQVEKPDLLIVEGVKI